MTVKTLRQLLHEPGIILAPGAYDAWSAMLVEMAGFPAVYMTGYGTSASILGQPDVGLLTMSEMTRQAHNMATAVGIPLVADGDTGYGGVLNVMRAVRAYEESGVAAIQLEDQAFPKRCGHMEGKELIPAREMAAKIEAAVHVRQSDDFLIVARTDARAVNGLADALERAAIYASSGADIIFIEAPRTVDEMEEIASEISAPLLANMVEGGKTPFLSAGELERMGFKLVIYPVSVLYASTWAIRELLDNLKQRGDTGVFLSRMVSFAEFNDLIGVEKVRTLEKFFFPSEH